MGVVITRSGDDHGEAYREAAQTSEEILVRPAWFAALSHAGPAARREREGAGDADGAAGEAVPLCGGPDPGEGEPDSGQVEDAFFITATGEPSWAWSGSRPEPVTTHVYLSTGCFHGDHVYCQSGVRGDGGTKRPGRCKFCDARCICSCHSRSAVW